MKKLRTFFMAFFRIGLFTFGGGYAILPMLEREIVEKYGWATREELLDYFAIGQCTPGVIAVNTATLVGYKMRGVWGAIAATAGVVTPSLIIITIIAAVLSNFADTPAVIHAFAGIRVAVSALLASAVYKLFKSNVLTKPSKPGAGAFIKCNALPLLLCVCAFVCVGILGASPVYVVIGACGVGILLYGRQGKR